MVELVENPNIAKLEWKPKMIERYSKLTDIEVFKKYSCSYLRKSLRVNTLKKSVAEIKERLEKNFKLEPIPFCKEGFWVYGERTDLGNLLEHTLGYVYIQEAASMIPPVVLDPKPGELVLDMCAAPGSKTTQIGCQMRNKGFIVANELTWQRIMALGLNVQRCGLTNYSITNMKGQKIPNLEFDKVLIDAPCSASGTIRKSASPVITWNPKTIQKISKIQKELMEHGFNILKPGGVLVYSTCTLEPEENEEVVDFLLKKFDNARVEEIELDINRSPAIVEFEGAVYSDEVKKCLRIWPQDNDTEGFFIAKIRKE
ncbi:RsmB/NOP family class I SAM-dependent RNA methyltransferase [Candidatus Woesearchaeota archaeon]|jgi:tRNA (cytosine49-C5)-methyltransferase|nr:RsmB/NOP family class I SAM-dependent RNA methyltransferase [Candidatus Woesearchaeota archaeon]